MYISPFFFYNSITTFDFKKITHISQKVSLEKVDIYNLTFILKKIRNYFDKILSWGESPTG